MVFKKVLSPEGTYSKFVKHPFMAALLFFVGIWLIPFLSFGATATVKVIHSQDKYQTGGSYPILFHIRISKSLFMHGTNPREEGLIPTALSFPKARGIRVEDVRFPLPVRERFEYAKEPVEVFSGDIFVKAMLVVKETASSGKHLINGRLSYQACSINSCLPPEKVAVLFSLMVVPQGTPTELINTKIFESGSSASVVQKPVFGTALGVGLWFTLLGIFLGGLALNLTPCIYPLIPITVSYFGGRSGNIRGRTIIHGILYILGLACTNSALGLTAALSGGLLGSVLQNPLVLILVAGILFSLGLSFFGLWEFRIPLGLTRLASKNFGGYFGTFFIGLTLGIVAAPCLGPFILGLLTYVGQKGEPLLGFLYFFVLSIGMGLPLAVLGIFTGALDKLPTSGEWMVWMRKVLGWILLGMAVYIIMPLIPSPVMKPALLSFVLVAAGIHLGWLDKSRSIRRVFFYIKKGVGIILIIGAILFFAAAVPRGEGIKWVPYEPSFVQEAKEENRPVMLDFYADWCGPCRTMEKKVFRNSAVVTLGKEFVTLRIDLTKSHPYQESLQEKYKIRGVPTIIFLNRQGVEEKALRIESYVGPEEVIRRMESIVKTPE